MDLLKASSLDISERGGEYLLVLKYNSKDGDKIWAAVKYPGSVFDGIRVYNSDEKYE